MKALEWRRANVPGRQTRDGNMWSVLIPDDLVRQMRLTPGVTYALTDGIELRRFTTADTAALSRACPRPFRMQSRAAGKGFRNIWVSCDPGHWERLGKKSGDRGGEAS